MRYLTAVSAFGLSATTALGAPMQTLEQQGFWEKFLGDPIALLTLALFVIGGWQLAVARNTARRQLRAYLMWDGAVMMEAQAMPGYPAEKVGHLMGVVALKNSGVTPAYKIRHWADVCILETRLEHTLPIPNSVENRSVAVAPHNATVTKSVLLGRKLTDAEITDIQSGSRAVYIWGRVEYEDAFKKKRYTTYRFKYSGSWPPPQSHSFSFCDEGNHGN